MYQPTAEAEAAAIAECRRKRWNYGGVCACCGKTVKAEQVQIGYAVDGRLVREFAEGAKAMVVGAGCRKRLPRNASYA
jgi:hypothetical protein